MAAYVAQRAAFRKLHSAGCFVMPNPWDVGSACYLRTLGFRALATTSAGMSFARGVPDRADTLPRSVVLRHIADMVVAAGALPVNADFQAGFAADAAGVAESVRLCINTGVAGLSIEDATGDPRRPLYELPEALERLAAAREAIAASGADIVLTARAECYPTRHPDPLRESIRRLEAYAAAGADVLYAPGPRAPDEIRALVSAVSPKPVNVLVMGATALTVDDLAGLGVRRISTGSALARAAWGALQRAAGPLAKGGSFAGLTELAASSDLNGLFEREQSTVAPAD